MVVMSKPVQLQGSGRAGWTLINAVKAPADKIDDWRAYKSMV